MPSILYQNNFVGGVISPSLFARSDLAMYYRSAAVADNFVVSKEGTLRKRRGIVSFAQLDGVEWEGAILVPYKYDRTNGAVLVLYLSGGDLKIRIYSKSSWDSTKYEYTALAECGMTHADVKKFQYTQIGDNIYMSNGKKSFIVRMVMNESGDCVVEKVYLWEKPKKPDPPISCGASYSGPTAGASASKIYYYQAYIVKNGVKSDGRASKGVKVPIPWQVGGVVTVSVKIPSDMDFDYVVLGKKAGTLYGEVIRWYPDDFGSSLSISFQDDNVSPGDPIYNQTDILGKDWGNDPICTNAFQQRLVFANATIGQERYPMTLWFSEVGNLNNFNADRPATDADPFSPTIFSTGPAFIRYMLSFQEVLILFTDCGLFSISFSQQSGFSASSCRISKFSDISVSPNIQPVTTEAGVVFVSSDEKTVYTISYDIQTNAMKPTNQSVLVEHLTRERKITSISLAEYPQNVVYATLSDGTMISLTFEKDQEVFAWSTQSLSGSMTVEGAISLGTVSEDLEDRSFTDIVMCVRKGDSLYLCTGEYRYSDMVGGEETEIESVLVTLRPETQDRSISARPKNVKDVIISVYQTGPLCVKAEDGGLDPVCRDPGDSEYSGEIKIAPYGHINDDGQIVIISRKNTPCEILAVKQLLEF